MDRTLGPGALGGGPGVEAALFGWDIPVIDDIVNVATKYGPTVLDLAKKYGPALAAAL